MEFNTDNHWLKKKKQTKRNPQNQKPTLHSQPVIKWQKSIKCTFCLTIIKRWPICCLNIFLTLYPFIKDNFLGIIKYDEPPKEKSDHLSASLVINIHLQYMLGLFYNYLSDRRISSFPWFGCGFFFCRLYFFLSSMHTFIKQKVGVEYVKSKLIWETSIASACRCHGVCILHIYWNDSPFSGVMKKHFWLPLSPRYTLNL